MQNGSNLVAKQVNWAHMKRDPNCIEAIDGKHNVMQPPSNAGSYFYNYKHTHSVVIHEMAVAGPDTLMLVPMAGCQIGWAWKKYHLAGALEDGSFHFLHQNSYLITQNHFHMF